MTIVHKLENISNGLTETETLGDKRAWEFGSTDSKRRANNCLSRSVEVILRAGYVELVACLLVRIRIKFGN